ncbi:MAG TPA: Fe(3+) ABC transporter substrate-binding protein [Hydrogenophaga sp.]|uniref:extracellular solute-binding protein n=1 Tax=Hydrogenophaga TaxID=47420 RepID=UPI0008AE1D43|nr:MULTISPECIES: extracellular solute-binding protein [Hydrogenophaga]MBU4184284.1 extracellular solute-binding protein [Gammaproteobacteria bacterium]OGA77869.1 MAG: Fe(3+) ABC transporter substrate-binding protein [Burkholderiales bacterium GWE1_65_30]OGA94219.1 MAG: Fe(3+) ABC transporter substrate-binding protein [Burkholderiales bacterium GWF1_66_17]OGB36067.1 MAG: Fe(3+) ABC transporter substrate-binding protein [Burkholderiales bacterium RIFCSPLOWO2_02_FULL_66_35]PKO76721.1 MAG: Fe(3+) 
MRNTIKLSIVLAAASAALGTQAQDKVLNLYSARHYQTDEVMYDTFTKTTGIKINRVDADDAGIVARLRAEGAASPADVILLVDAARMASADSQGLFQPIKSAKLDAAIPANLRADATKDGVTWTGFSTRARVIIYDPLRVKAADVATYEQLADPKLKGLVCTRSGSHPYNLSLFATVVERLGDAKGEEWLKGVVANMARAPKGGDTDQIKAVASGECGVALTNTYYVARMIKSSKPEDRSVMEKVRVVFPNQGTSGTHVNIAGAAVAKHAKNKDNAIAFMEFLASPFAQDYFANGNNEFPAVKGLKVDNPAIKAMGGDNFKAEQIPLGVVAKNMTKVQQMLDRAGYK